MLTDADKLLIYEAYERAFKRMRVRWREVEAMPPDEFRHGWLSAWRELWDEIGVEAR